ncbi:MAG: nuclear transport factor 2 family protein [Flavobacteriales bacterium]
MSVITRFYTAFANRDWAEMGACYHREARFSDPVFPDLDVEGARAMWKMLLTSGRELRITYSVLDENANGGNCTWEAYYKFSRSGRQVHNMIASAFTIKDGLILTQRDEFDFWRWSGQALGLNGMLLGWTPFLRNKVRAMAAENLRKARSAG